MHDTALKLRPKRAPLAGLRDGVVVIPPALTTDRGLLYAADCLDLFAGLKDESIHTIFADPPFNLAKDYGNGSEKDDLRRDGFRLWA